MSMLMGTDMFCARYIRPDLINRPESAHFEQEQTTNPNISQGVIITIEDNNEAVRNESKLVFPFLYWSWDNFLRDAKKLILRCQIDETKSFKGTCVRSFILQMLLPIFVIAIFLISQVYFPTYTLWFSWIGFLVAIFVLYRIREFSYVYYYLNSPHKYLPPTPDYPQDSRSIRSISAPPPYTIATDLPPAYVLPHSQPNSADS